MAYTEKGRQLVDTTIAFLVLSIVAVALRFLGRWKRRRALIASDYLVIASLVVSIAYFGVTIGGVNRLGGTIEYTELPVTSLPEALKIIYALELLLTIAITLAKLSLLLLFHEIFISRSFRLANYVVMGFTVTWCIVLFFVFVFQCRPVANAWSLEAHAPGSSACFDGSALVFGYEMSNIFIDILIILLPIRQVWQLQMNMKKKLATLFVFATGGFVMVTSVIRAVVVYQPAVEGGMSSITLALIWTSVQLGVTVICACLPTLPSIIVDSFNIAFAPLTSWLTTRRSDRRNGPSNELRGPRGVPLDTLKTNTLGGDSASAYEPRSFELNKAHGQRGADVDVERAP